MKNVVIALAMISTVTTTAAGAGLPECNAVSQNVLALYDHSTAAILDATKAGFAADALDNRDNFRVVEDNYTANHNDVLLANAALGPLMGAELKNPKVIEATSALIDHVQGTIIATQLLSQLSLSYERAVNTRNARRRRTLTALPFALIAPAAAAGYMAGSNGAHVSTSTTTMTANGQTYNATTRTYDYAESQALQAAISATQEQQRQALETYTPVIANQTYAITPLFRAWVEACGGHYP
jgi:hypothetical protein